MIFLLHPVFYWYTMIQIFYQYFLKIIGRRPVMKSYDGKEKIDISGGLWETEMNYNRKKDYFRKIDVNTFKVVTIIVSIIMLMAYLFMYTNAFYLQDGIWVMANPEVKVTTDKFMWIMNRFIDYGVMQPWLSGILSIACLSVAVYCIIDLFEITKVIQIIGISGIVCVNTVTICAQINMGGGYYFSLALMYATLGAWFIAYEKSIYSIVLGCIFVVFSAGTYGAYVSVCPALLMFREVYMILSGRENENVKRVLRYVGYFIASMICYVVVLRLLIHITGGGLTSYMNEDVLASNRGILSLYRHIPECYFGLFDFYLDGGSSFIPEPIYNILHIIFIISVIITAMLFLCNIKKISLVNRILVVFAGCISPIVINLIYILSSGQVHYYMVFTYYVPFCFFVKEVDILKEKFKHVKFVYSLYSMYMLLLLLFLYRGIVCANALAIHMYHMYVESEMIASNMISRIECVDDFKTDDVVVFYGDLERNDYYKPNPEDSSPILRAYMGVAGGGKYIAGYSGIGNVSWMIPFYTRVLNSSLTYIDYDEFEDVQDNRLIDHMNVYPEDGSIIRKEGFIYIKLSEW